MNTNRISLKQIAECLVIITCLIFSTCAVAEDLFHQQTLRIGFHRPSFHEYSREDLVISVKIITEEMGKDLGIETNVAIYEDMKLMNADFENGTINLIFASPLLIANEVDNTLLADGFKMIPSGGNADRLVILTRKNEGMDNFKSLRNKKLGLVENDPTSDLYVNFLSQSNFKKDFQDTLKKMPREKKSHQVILKLFFGQIDVTCVYESFFQTTTELNPQILERVQIIEHIDGILQSAGFFHKNVDPAFRESVINAVLKLNTYPRGQQFLEIFKTEEALPVSPSELTITKKLFNDYQHLKTIK
ncbi:MAG: PhnD/SsuA/transferrin family substrate-binding protein [Methylococcaceae bacterium]|nr:PhnD/SsuA/transferrin family substrate-binding protein [Methylococcaceae bacterium]MDZ4157960.1 PhnD/SsuA/transferrin family substrate-binding protein [Methylococcales bacterium]MDP2393548.1 PhnD/SsuA/transferrin family substrate-binding protein [Methylococcaceae bacterium]MDP3020780.1 PhnD/SsuA/transferrin family substrate-binding protein [Methylococcaceae bacterium]MDP3390611.1 PhnD/SsuA/transferrin family substrate-binding protein [Methylococcaceae bacterium]